MKRKIDLVEEEHESEHEESESSENTSDNESNNEESSSDIENQEEEEEVASDNGVETEGTQESDNDTENDSQETESSSPETETLISKPIPNKYAGRPSLVFIVLGTKNVKVLVWSSPQNLDFKDLSQDGGYSGQEEQTFAKY
ncbi:unnamed protein product [Porites lobata]|uniref:Uncharacterized protein n=1 Tax=Porites lobata TaxID=104759 RepID=A0ABN8NTG5_9CNID|nr:unnamed protein product [Porites lobata]